MPRLVAATFVSRPNRFIVMARLRGGSTVRCHLGDPGRLRELLLPGAALRLRPAGPRAGGAPRRTRYTVSLVRAHDAPRPWAHFILDPLMGLPGECLLEQSLTAWLKPPK